MPTLIELSARTRLGGAVGIYGAEGVVTTWYVATDAVDDDPVEVLSTPGNGGVAIGQEYPWGNFGVVAIGYVPRERYGPKEFEIDVLYGPPIEFPTNDWTVTTSSAVEVREELSAVVTDARGEVVLDPQGRPKRNPIGPRIYIEQSVYNSCSADRRPSVDSGLFNVVAEDGCREVKTLRRIAPDSRRRVKGITVTKPVADIYYSCVVTQLNRRARQIAQTYLNSVNGSHFDGYDPWTMKCTEITISRRQGIVEGQAVTNVVYDIGIRFLLDYEKHMPVLMFDTFIDQSSGAELFIKENESDVPVYTEYLPYGESNFLDLLNLFLPPRRISGGR